jgi:hypothetical protein
VSGRTSQWSGSELRAALHDIVDFNASYVGHEFWLLSDEQPVAYLRYGDFAPTLMEIACADARWRLTKRNRHGWDLGLERIDDHSLLGQYRARDWLAGGTIELARGPSVAVRKRPGGPWRLQMSRAKPFAEIPRHALTWHRDEPLQVIVKSLPPMGFANLHLSVLTVCALGLLEDESVTLSTLGGS